MDATTSVQKKNSILSEETITEQILLHPSQLGKLKQSISKELKKKAGKWDHERQGVLTSYTGKKEILHGGRGRMVDTCAFIRIQVRYTAVFAKPQIDAVIKGRITSISS